MQLYIYHIYLLKINSVRWCQR